MGSHLNQAHARQPRRPEGASTQAPIPTKHTPLPTGSFLVETGGGHAIAPQTAARALGVTLPVSSDQKGLSAAAAMQRPNLSCSPPGTNLHSLQPCALQAEAALRKTGASMLPSPAPVDPPSPPAAATSGLGPRNRQKPLPPHCGEARARRATKWDAWQPQEDARDMPPCPEPRSGEDVGLRMQKKVGPLFEHLTAEFSFLFLAGQLRGVKTNRTPALTFERNIPTKCRKTGFRRKRGNENRQKTADLTSQSLCLATLPIGRGAHRIFSISAVG